MNQSKNGMGNNRRACFGFGLLGLSVVALIVVFQPDYKARRKYERWIQNSDWWDPALSSFENASNRLAALEGVTPTMVRFCIEDLEEKEPLKDRIIAKLPDFLRRRLPEPRQFRPRKYAATRYLRDLGHPGSNAIPAVVACLSGSDINQSMFAAWTLGEIGSGQPQVIHALEGATNFTYLSVDIMAAFALWEQNSNRTDALAILNTGLRDKKKITDPSSMNVIFAIGELGSRGKLFGPALRACLTNSVSGREVDVWLRALAARALWQVERSPDGVDAYFELVTNMPSELAASGVDSAVGLQLERLREGQWRNLGKVPGFNSRAVKILDSLAGTATADELAELHKIESELKAAK